MDSDRDYYRILEVDPRAPAALIAASYRALRQRARGAHGALLDEAYAVLSDAGRRAEYDRLRAAAVERAADFAATVLLDDEARPRGARSDDPRATAVLDVDPSATAVLGLDPNATAVLDVDPDATAVLDPDAARLAAHRCLFCGAAHGLERAVDRDDDCRTCSSPLLPAARHRLEYSGQRMIERVAKRARVDFWAAWPQPEPYVAEMTDISLNGMQIRVAAHLEIDQIVKIDCESCSAVARVAHCERDTRGDGPHERWSVGLEFLTLRFAKPRGTFISARV